MDKVVFKTTLVRTFGWVIDFLCVRRVASKMSVNYAKRGHPMAVFANDLIGIDINQYGIYEAEELDLLFNFLSPVLKEFSTGIALDIGANIGNHSLYFSKIFSKVLAYEPNPRTYRLLKFNTDFLSNINTFDYGLGEKKGKFKMVENTTNMGNSHIASNHTSEENGIEVIVETLDGVLANVARVDFVKIDVEGFEEGVLNGAIKTINAHQPLIVFEQHENEFVGDATPSITLLKNLGYEFCWQHRKQPKIASQSYILRRLFDVYRIIFGETLEIKTGPNVPKQYHSMLIAVPKRFVSLMNH
ncbi:MAG: FkbM family methyltransferase, partial [Chitinophagaceae bacterium]